MLIATLGSCNSVFEKDISEETLTLILPTDGQSYSTNQIHFKWTEMKGASDYRIEIVKPTFVGIQEFVLDTLVSGTEFYYILNPGDYQFQIRGENSGYESIYTGPYSIHLDSVTDLSNQLVQLLVPADNYYISENSLNCTWQSIYAADYYEFQLRGGLDFNSSVTILHLMSSIYSNSYDIPSEFLTEGEYAWGIKAVNENSSSEYSSNSFTVDLTLPNDVALLQPTDNDNSATQTVVFKWDTGTDPGTVNTPVFSTIEIYEDAALTILNLIQTNIYTDSLEHTFTNSGDYWWQVYAEDEAGNSSEYYSELRKVTVP